MGRYRYSQLFLNLAYCVLFFCMADLRPFLVGVCVKLIASLVFAGLLAFVVVHPPNISKLLAAFLQAVPIAQVPLFVDRLWAAAHSVVDIAPAEPILSPLFQRPPPMLFL